MLKEQISLSSVYVIKCPQNKEVRKKSKFINQS